MDLFIDAIITINIENQLWVEISKNEVLLFIHTIFRPLQLYEPLKQDDPLLLHNLEGESKLDKHKTCQEWEIQNRSLQVFLPIEKETAWVRDII